MKDFLLRSIGIPSDEEFQKDLAKYRKAYYIFEDYLDDDWREFLQPIMSRDWASMWEFMGYVKEQKLKPPRPTLDLPPIVAVTSDGVFHSEQYETEFCALIKKVPL